MLVEDLFPNDDVQTLYVSRTLKNPQAIIDWAKEQGFKSCLEASDLHVTIAYSKEKVDWHQTTPMVDTIRVEGDHRFLEKLGDAIVLRFNSNDLNHRWNEFIDMGCSWDYDSYKQHVTITYEGKDINFKKMKPYEGVLIFGPEKFAPIRKNYTSHIHEKNLTESILRPFCRLLLRILSR